MLLCACALLASEVRAQSRKDLEEKRAQLDRQLRTTNNLLEQARKEQKNTQQQVALLNARITQRQELISTVSSEVRRAEERISENEAVLASLQGDLERLKEDYARMVRSAYQNRNAYDRLSYLFAAESFAQAFKRSRYLAQLAEYRQRQAALIGETQESIANKLEELKGVHQEKARLLDEQEAEKQRLVEDRSGQQSTLDGLKQEETRLRETARKQEKQKREIDSAIRRAIENELKAQQRSGAGGKGTGLTLTPEARELGADLEKNKGKLPWPVERGVITSSFGKQAHPVLKGITIENNGVDITTEKNATVRAIFRGEVSSVIVIPGAGKAVIVSHGAYRTVYSNLRDVSVSKGQKVDTKQAIGTVMTTDNGNVTHLEVWKITSEGMTKADPALWLYKN